MTLPWRFSNTSSDESSARGAPAPRDRTAHLDVSGPDESVVVALRAGHAPAFEQLYLGHHQRLSRIAFVFLNAWDDAEDAVQAVFVRLWNGRSSLRVSGTLESYLYGAVRNEALRLLKHRRVVDRTASAFSAEGHGPAAAAPPLAPDAAFERDETEARLARALASLPERRRLALTLRWGEDMAYRDIGIVLGISEQAAQMLVTRAKRDLQAIVDAP